MAFSLYPSLGLFRGLVIMKVVLQRGAQVSSSLSSGQPGIWVMAVQDCVFHSTRAGVFVLKKITL